MEASSSVRKRSSVVSPKDRSSVPHINGLSTAYLLSEVFLNYADHTEIHSSSKYSDDSAVNLTGVPNGAAPRAEILLAGSLSRELKSWLEISPESFVCYAFSLKCRSWLETTVTAASLASFFFFFSQFTLANFQNFVAAELYLAGTRQCTTVA